MIETCFSHTSSAFHVFFHSIHVVYVCWLICGSDFSESKLLLFVLYVKGDIQNCSFGARFLKWLRMSSVNSYLAHICYWHPSSKWPRNKQRQTEIVMYLWVPLVVFFFPQSEISSKMLLDSSPRKTTCTPTINIFTVVRMTCSGTTLNRRKCRVCWSQVERMHHVVGGTAWKGTSWAGAPSPTSVFDNQLYQQLIKLQFKYV